MKLIDTEKLKKYAVAGIGGGAVNAIVDKFLGDQLSGLGEFAGYAGADLALIAIAQYGSRKTDGMLKQAFDGMGVISMYETFYEDLLGGIFGESSPAPNNPRPEGVPTQNDILARMV